MFFIRHSHLARSYQPTIFAGQTNCLSTVVINQHDDVLLHLAAQNPFNHFHGLFVGDTHALHERALLTYFFKCAVDLWSTSMHHYWVHAH